MKILRFRLILPLVVVAILACQITQVTAEEDDKTIKESDIPEDSIPIPNVSSLSINSPARLEALKILIERKKFREALSLANVMLEHWEGDARFDFYYGMAAVETQLYDEALFGFERLVMQYGRHPRYRLELARTHFYLRNIVRAKKEFNRVLKLNPPPAVRKNVQKFLDQISLLERSVESSFTLAIDVAGGFDSNINSATASSELSDKETVFPFPIALDDDSRETGSSYWSTLASMFYLHPLSKISHFDVRFMASKRENSKTDLYNLDSALAELGYAINTGPVRWRLAGRYQYVQLNSEHFLDTQGGVAQIQWRTDGGWMYGLTGNYGETIYPDNSTSDLDQQQYSFVIASPPSALSSQLTLIYGEDTAKEEEGDYNGKTYLGFNYLSTIIWGQRGSGYWSFNLTDSEYKAIQPLYKEIREDLATTLGFGFRFAFTSSFSIRNDYSAGYTSSTLDANTYKRFKAELGLTYVF